MSFFRVALLSALFLFFVTPQSVFAQSASGVGLQPSLIERGASQGEVLNESIAVTNLSDQEQTYYLLLKDITTVAEGGRPVYADPGLEKTGFELTEWLTLETEEVTLLPGEKREIDVTITVPEDASPGSHFGGIFISMQPPRLRQVGASVGYEVANIVSIRIAGDVTESAIIRSFKTNKLVYGETKVQFSAEIENRGNVLVRPIGPVTVQNMFGKEVAQMTLNESKSGIFPYTKRAFEITWKDENIGFGRYQASLAMTYGDLGRQATIVSTASFWILPMNIITPALIILGVLLLTAYIAVRMYIRRTVASMSGGRRLVRKRRRGGTSTLLLIAIVMLVVTALFLIVLLLLFA